MESADAKYENQIPLSIRSELHHPHVADGAPFQECEMAAVGRGDAPCFEAAHLLPQERRLAIQVDMQQAAVHGGVAGDIESLSIGGPVHRLEPAPPFDDHVPG